MNNMVQKAVLICVQKEQGKINILLYNHGVLFSSLCILLLVLYCYCYCYCIVVAAVAAADIV